MSRSGQRLAAFARAAARRLVAGTRRLFTSEPGSEGAGEVEAEAARELARSSGRLRGGMTKLAQLMAYHQGPGAASDGEARRALAALWDHAPAVDAAAIRAVVREDLGGDAFAEWDDTPLAAASLGQVHAAVARDGTRLAVKVQYPGVAEALRADLASAGLLRALAGAEVGRSLAPEAISALRDAVLGELDYRAEGRWLQKFRKSFGDLVPKYFPELSSPRVLTAERFFGKPLGALDETERPDAALRIFNFAWRAPLVHRLLNADPNPGNYVVLDGARPVKVGFVDFGCSTDLDAGLVAADRKLWRAVLARDGESLRHAVYQEGLLGRARTLDSSTFREWEAYLAAPFLARAGFAWTAGYARGLADLTSRLVRAGGLRLPANALLLWRQRLGVAAVIGSLDVTADFARELRQVMAMTED